MATTKIPREGLADLLDRLAKHARSYVITGCSVSFDGTMYRVVVEGDGELLPGDGDRKEDSKSSNSE